MKNKARKIITIGLGICCYLFWFVSLLFMTKPYTEKVVIWLPDNYELKNNVENGIVSIIPKSIDNSYQSTKSSKIFYSQTDMDSFKRLFGKGKVVEVSVEDATINSDTAQYRIIYQARLNYGDDLVIVAQEYYRYNKETLLEMRLVDRMLLLENKRDIITMSFLSIVGFFAISFLCCVYVLLKEKSNSL